MSWETDLANEFNLRNNISKIGAVVGTVLNINPLKIGILNNKVILDNNNSYINSLLLENYKRKAEIEIEAYNLNVSGTVNTPHGTGNLTNISFQQKINTNISFKNIFKTGDKVLVISSDSNQNFFIIDKIFKSF